MRAPDFRCVRSDRGPTFGIAPQGSHVLITWNGVTAAMSIGHVVLDLNVNRVRPLSEQVGSSLPGVCP